MTYRPDIDGLRGVAVAGVVLFHAGLPVPGGFTGVDVFFVISGYLITRLIRERLEAGTFTLRGFFRRRILRIVPAAATVAGVVTAASFAVFTPEDAARVARSAVAAMTLSANVHFAADLDYFGPAAELKPLLHTWSLSIEEQFYIAYPFVLVALVRNVPTRVAAVLAGSAVVSFATAVYYASAAPDAAFYDTASRVWEFLAGGLVAVTAFPGAASGKVAKLLSWAGAAAIAASFACERGILPFPGVGALPAVAGAAAVIAGGGRGAGAALSWGPLVWIGRISYSLYLWHWPVIVFYRYLYGEQIPPGVAAGLIAVSVAISAASWRFIEEPPRRVGKRFGRAVTAAVASAAAVAVAAWCGTGVVAFERSEGVLGWRVVFFPPPEVEAGWPDGQAPKLRSGIFWAAPDPPSGVGDLPAFGAAGRPPDVLLFGDSFAGTLVPTVDRIARDRGWGVRAAILPSTPPLAGCVTTTVPQPRPVAMPVWTESVYRIVEEARIPLVILLASWRDYHGWLREDGSLGGRTLAPADAGRSRVAAKSRSDADVAPVAAAAFRAAFEDSLSRLREAGAAVVVLQASVLQIEDLRRLVRANDFDEIDRRAKSLDLFLRENGPTRAAIAESTGDRPGVALADGFPEWFDGERSRVRDGSTLWYADKSHLNSRGVEALLAPSLERAINRLRDEGLTPPVRAVGPDGPT